MAHRCITQEIIYDPVTAMYLFLISINIESLLLLCDKCHIIST